MCIIQHTGSELSRTRLPNIKRVCGNAFAHRVRLCPQQLGPLHVSAPARTPERTHRIGAFAFGVANDQMHEVLRRFRATGARGKSAAHDIAHLIGNVVLGVKNRKRIPNVLNPFGKRMEADAAFALGVTNDQTRARQRFRASGARGRSAAHDIAHHIGNVAIGVKKGNASPMS